MHALVALLMGLAYVAAPGPINVETVRRGAAGGFGPALCLQFGSLTGELLYAALALLGAGTVLSHAAFQLALALLGIGLLLYFGCASLLEGTRGLRGGQGRVAYAPSAPVRQSSARHSLLSGAAISLASPFALAFWLSVGGSAIRQSHADPATFVAGFFAGVLLWAVALPLLIWACRSAVGGRASHFLSVGCGLALVAFGAALGTNAALAAGHALS